MCWKGAPPTLTGAGSARQETTTGEIQMIKYPLVLFLSVVPFACGSQSCSGSSGSSSSPADAGRSSGVSTGSGGAGGTPITGNAGAAGTTGTTGTTGPSDSGDAPPDFGPNVLIFDPSMTDIQPRIDAIFAQQADQFGVTRHAYFFKPGRYNLDVQLAFYMQVVGLGQSPDDVTITGAVRSKDRIRADGGTGSALGNFWRGIENLAVVPQQDGGAAVWAVSQGAFARRVHVLGPLHLSDVGFSSGGFLADSKIDGAVSSGTQQQYFSRNTDWASWAGSNWNMVFVGAVRPPVGAWPALAYTVVPQTPLVREKPFFFIDAAGKYFVSAPALRSNSVGVSWTPGASAEGAVPIDRFYIARPDLDTAASINLALSQGKNLIFTPGIYHLDDTLRVSQPNTIVLGLGIPTLVPDQGIAVMSVADVDGVELSGFMVDAGTNDSPTLLEVGPPGSTGDHASNPTFLHDIFCRIGGATVGTATSCLTINSNNVVGDNLWLWRADHGAGAVWTVNMSKNGLIVNGNDVTMYGLFVEHFQEFQTLWNGNGGHVFFYQSEMPYDPPTQADWQHDGVNGFASYKVIDTVTTHEAWGLGIYSVLRMPVVAENAAETAVGAGIMIHHVVDVWIPGVAGSSITHIINGTGNSVPQGATTVTLARTPN